MNSGSVFDELPIAAGGNGVNEFLMFSRCYVAKLRRASKNQESFALRLPCGNKRAGRKLSGVQSLSMDDGLSSAQYFLGARGIAANYRLSDFKTASPTPLG